MELRQPDMVLANAVDNLKSLWNTIRALDFDLVVEPDTLLGMILHIHQIALVKPHLVHACDHLEQWLSRAVKHIWITREILPTVRDPDEILPG